MKRQRKKRYSPVKETAKSKATQWLSDLSQPNHYSVQGKKHNTIAHYFHEVLQPNSGNTAYADQ